MGGVSASLPPQMILISVSVFPAEFWAAALSRYSPADLSEPMMIPVFESSDKPAGRLFAVKLIGRSPLTASECKNGVPGRTPTTIAPLKCGAAAGLAAVMICSSRAVRLVFGERAWAFRKFAARHRKKIPFDFMGRLDQRTDFFSARF